MHIHLSDIRPSKDFLADKDGQICQLFHITLNVMRSPADRRPLVVRVERQNWRCVSTKIAYYQLPTFAIWIPFTHEDACKVVPCRVQINCQTDTFTFQSWLAFGSLPTSLVRLDWLDKAFEREPPSTIANPFEYTSFSTDMAAYLERHNTVYQRPVADWMDGQLIGNGDLSAVVLNHGTVHLYLHKCDLWAGDETGPGLGSITAARVCIEADFLRETGACSLTMRLANATVETRGRSEHGSAWLSTRSWVAADRNLMVIEVEGVSPKRSQLQIRVARDRLPPVTMLQEGGREGNEWRYLDYEMQPRLTLATQDNVLVLEHELPNMSYAVACRILGAEAATHAMNGDDCVKGVCVVSVQGNFHITLCVAVATSLETRSPANSAKALVRRMTPGSLGEAREAHRDHWRAFWSKSFIHLDDDPFLENIWYVSLYHVACISRGAVAPAFLGSWWCEDLVPWFDQYVSDSQCQLDHWLCFSSNHLELARPFNLTYGGLMRRFMAHGPEGGLAAPHMFFPEHGMIDMSSEVWNCPYVSSAPWLFETFIWQYEYTQDRNYLLNFLYPLLKATRHTLLTTAICRDDQGVFHIYGNIPEQQDTATDNPMNLFILRMIFGRLVAYSKLLGVDEAERRAWQTLLNHLADYPQDEKFIHEAVEQAHPFRKHPSVYFPIFPGMELVPEDPLAAKFRNTFNRALEFWAARYESLYLDGRRWDSGGSEPNGHSLFWIAAVAARLGDGQRALDLSYNPGLLILLKPQGIGCHGGRKSHTWYRTADLDAASSLVTAGNEMLLQSYPDHFRIFFGAPKKWTASFARLRVRGAFLVSASMQKGIVREVVVESEVGGCCCLLNPWKRHIAVLENLRTGKRRTLRGDYLRFQTTPNGTYRLTAAGRPHPKPTVIPADEVRDSPRVIPLADLIADHGRQVFFPDIRHFQTSGQDILGNNALCIGLPPMDALPVPGMNPLAPTTPQLRRLLGSRDWKDRQLALAALGSKHLPAFVNHIIAALNDPQPLVRWTAAHKLALFVTSAQGESLRQDDPRSDFPHTVHTKVRKALVQLLMSPEAQQRWVAIRGLNRVAGTRFGYDAAIEPANQNNILKQWRGWLKKTDPAQMKI